VGYSIESLLRHVKRASNGLVGTFDVEAVTGASSDEELVEEVPTVAYQISDPLKKSDEEMVYDDCARTHRGSCRGERDRMC
jgi:hypothetical protein